MSIAHQEIFEYLKTVEDKIVYGDKQFYLSLKWQHENPQARGLSSSQVYHLEKMLNKYSKEEIEKRETFRQNYSDCQRLIALRCAWYYDANHPRYYGSIIDKVLNDPQGHALEYSEFNKMCNNKYAKKILAAYNEPQKFIVGDMVQIRASNRIDIANTDYSSGAFPRRQSAYRLANKVCMVLSVNEKPITRAAKGARLYKILVIDEAQPFYAHESDLKKYRKSKK